MVVVNIGETDAKTIISDNATPASGVYAWYIKEKSGVGAEARKALVDVELAANVSLKKKFYDLAAKFAIVGEHIRKQADWENLKDALDYWESNDILLYLNVQNDWGINLMTRATKADAAALPITQVGWTGKLMNFRIFPQSAEVMIAIEFHYSTA